MDISWSNNEVELIITDYFQMLIAELGGISVNKAEHRRQLLPLLNNRSAGSIEFKHQIISAVLINLGQPYITGYLPRFNFQKMLEEKVLEYLALDHTIENLFKSFAEKEIILPKSDVVFDNFVVPPPITDRVSEPNHSYLHLRFFGHSSDEQEQKYLYMLSTKTQYAGIKTHMLIIHLLKYLTNKYL